MNPRRSRSMWALGALVWLAAAVLPGYPATAETASQADEIPPGLTEVTLADSVKVAPVLASGRYYSTFTDVSDADSLVFKVERTMPRSVIRFGITMLVPADRPSLRLNIESAVDLRPDQGDGGVIRCGGVAGEPAERPVSMPLSTRGGMTNPTRPICVESDTMVFAIYPPKGAKVPLGTPFELDIWEVPEVTNPERLPYPSNYAAGRPTVFPPATQVPGGDYLSTAPLLTPEETTHSEVPLGRTVYYAVEVGFNEQLAARVDFSDPEGANPGAGAEVRILSPTAGFADSLSPGTEDWKRHGNLGAEGLSLQSRSALVNPRLSWTAFDTGYKPGTEQGLLSDRPGIYYLAVYLQNLTGDEDATVPIDISIALLPATGGLAQGADPVYAGEPAPFPAPEGPHPEPFDPEAAPPPGGTDRTESTEPGETESDRTAWIAAGLGLVAVVFAAIGALVLVRSRRS